MTRWARKGPANKKKPLPASSWDEMRNDLDTEAKSGKKHQTRNSGEVREKVESVPAKSDKTDDAKTSAGTIVNECKRKRKLEVTEFNEGAAQTAKKKKKKGQQDFAMEIDTLGCGVATELEEEEEASRKNEKLLEMERREKRTEGRRLKRIEMRQQKRVCFKCRQPGHDLSNCPEVKRLESGTGICFRCGSSSHKISDCKTKSIPLGKFPFANCFICGESGHLSRNCPDNRNGLYPNGGCCLGCGSIHHFKKDCPELKKKEENLMSVKTVDQCKSLDEEPTIVLSRKKETEQEPRKKVPKVVKF